MTGIMRGEGDTKWPFLIAVIGMWAVRLPLSFLCEGVDWARSFCGLRWPVTDFAGGFVLDSPEERQKEILT